MSDAVGEADRERALRAAPSPRAWSPFVPLLLVLIAAIAWSGFQCYQLYHEQQTLAALHAGQQRQVEESAKLRVSLDAIARETALLAESGNANAKRIVDELRRRGVRIDPTAAPVTAPGSAGP